jgi:hypothetical protein
MASERVILDWNIVNWITVVLMVAIGMAIFGMFASFVRGNLPSGGSQ